MTTQTRSLPASLSETLFTLPVAETPSAHIFADSRDYGFDFDEEEIGRELLAPLPVSLSMQTLPKVDADEFEKVFHYFLS